MLGRYGFFIFLLCGALILGFQAGKQGLKGKKLDQEVPFRSFPLFSDPHAGISSEMKEEKILVPQGVINEGKKEKKENTKDEEKKDKKKETLQKTLEKEQEMQGETLGPSRLDKEDAPSYLLQLYQTYQKEKKQERVKTLPQFSNLYVPLYADHQLGMEAMHGFRGTFPQQTVSQKIFVVEKEIGNTSQGIRYQVMVYDQTGRNFIGSFETQASHTFPFFGIPTFSAMEDGQFRKTSRLFIITNADKDIADFLQSESYVHSILRSAYKENLDLQAFLGTHKEFNFNIYTIFPGIFLAIR